eukprot:m.213597 g.213597  ORF g.213597 m.213597 type:complete len:163 (-) comp22171_c2_seq11:40-528(-)
MTSIMSPVCFSVISCVCHVRLQSDVLSLGTHFAGSRYDTAVDVYSYAIIMWEILTRKLPYADIANVAMHVLAGGRPKVSPNALRDHPSYTALMTQAWSPDSSSRPSFASIAAQLEHLKSTEPMTEPLPTARFPARPARRSDADPMRVLLLEDGHSSAGEEDN